MKIKLILVAALLSTTMFVSAEDDKAVKETENIEVTVDTDGGQVVKKIIVNGKELNAEEIKEFEASGKMKKLHMNHDDLDGKRYKVIMIDDDNGHEDMEKHIKIIKKHSSEGKSKVHKKKWVTKNDDETIEVTVDTDGEKSTEKVVVNGKELSAEEIEEFKASGKMKVIHLDKAMKGLDGQKMMFINSDSVDGDVDVEVIMEKIGQLHGKHDDKSFVQEWHSDDGKNIHIIEKKIRLKNNGGASLGVMVSVEDDGWHLTKVIKNSGAADVGIEAGDIVKSIAGIDMTKSSDSKSHEIKKLPKFKAGEMVKVVVVRDNKKLDFDVEARKLDNKEMLIDFEEGKGNHFKWVKEFKDVDDLSKEIKVMVFDGKDGDFKLNTEDIHMVFPESLGDMNIFVSDGHSTSKLLGKGHEMSSLSDDLAKYFYTKGGVLVLHVDDTNAFALKDGDVIKSVNGNSVKSPKDVVKELIQTDEQEKIELKVIRHKKSKTLKYKK